MDKHASSLGPHLWGLCSALALATSRRIKLHCPWWQSPIMYFLLASLPSFPHCPVVLPELFSQMTQTKTTTQIVYSQTPVFPERALLTLLLTMNPDSHLFLFTPSPVWWQASLELKKRSAFTSIQSEPLCFISSTLSCWQQLLSKRQYFPQARLFMLIKKRFSFLLLCFRSARKICILSLTPHSQKYLPLPHSWRNIPSLYWEIKIL